MPSKHRRPRWVRVGLVLLWSLGAALLLAVLLLLLGYAYFRYQQRAMLDPASRERRAKEILGCHEFPEGYHAALAYSLPLIFKTAAITDRDPDSNGEIWGSVDKGFAYIDLINTGQYFQELRDYFEGKTDDTSVFERSTLGFRFRPEAIVRRGVLSTSSSTVMYLAEAGRIESIVGDRMGVSCFMMILCPRDSRLRVAIWSEAQPPGSRPDGSQPWRGTPADEEEISRFLAHFRLCPE